MVDRIIRLAATLLMLAVAGLGQWFFGNLYEAVVMVPNWRVGFVYEAMTSRPQYEAGSPMRYYVPTTQVAIVLLWAASLLAWRAVPEARRWLGLGSLLALAATVLTIYIVTQLNLRLFFGDRPLALSEAAPLMRQWALLNDARLVLVGSALASAANALRIVHRGSILRERIGVHPMHPGPA